MALETVNPATDELVRSYPEASTVEVAGILEAAHAAFEDWRVTPFAARATPMRKAAALLRASCAARLAEGKTSSLVVAGREGVPLEPGGLMPSALMEPRRVAELGSVVSFLTSEWPGLRLAYLDAACGR